MRHAYWGQEHSPAETEAFLRAENIPYTRMKDEDAVLDRVVDALESGQVVGWFQGRGEWGPRALGHRSIIADPRKPGMKDVVNTKIKFREPFRPFAPSVLVDRASEIFELAAAERHMPARYMLYVVDVKPEYRERIAATTHVDGTARLQTVDREVSPLYHRLIERFESGDGRAGGAEHVVQPQGRADRELPRGGLQHLLPQRHGHAGRGRAHRREERRARVIKTILMRFSIAGELLSFLWEVKLWWMIPMVFVLLLCGGVVILAQSSAIAPFIYALF